MPRRIFPALTVGWLVGLLTLFTFVDDAVTAVPALTAGRALFVVLAGLLAARWATEPAALPRPGRVEAVMTAYVALLLASWARTLPGKSVETLRLDGVLVLEGYVMPFAAYAFGRVAAADGLSLRRASGWLAGAAGAYLALVGWLEWAAHLEVFAPRTLEVLHPERVSGPFTNPMTYGMACSALGFLALALASVTDSMRSRMAAAGLGGGLLLAAILSAGRGVWLGLAVGLLWSLVRRPHGGRVLLAAVGVGIALVGAGSGFRSARDAGPRAETGVAPPVTTAEATASPEPSTGPGTQPGPPPPPVTPPTSTSAPPPVVLSYAERLTEVSPIQSRIGIWAVTASMIVERPLLGFGFASDTLVRLKPHYAPISARVPVEWADWPVVPHNDFLFLLVTCGLPGLAIHVGLLLVLWADLRRATAAADPLRAAVGVAASAFFLALLVNAQFMDLAYAWQPQALFFYLAGLLRESGR